MIKKSGTKFRILEHLHHFSFLRIICDVTISFRTKKMASTAPSFSSSFFLSLLSLSLLSLLSVHAQTTEVMTESGPVSGVVLDSGLYAYLGIPYAASPTEERRWREPVPHTRWNETFQAVQYGPSCIQVCLLFSLSLFLSLSLSLSLHLSFSLPLPLPPCLFLDVRAYFHVVLIFFSFVLFPPR
jgi:hypothetical protein